jgi:hypothetical protein
MLAWDWKRGPDVPTIAAAMQVYEFLKRISVKEEERKGAVIA